MPDPNRQAAADSTSAEQVRADQAWLRAEFDAIIAASFPTVSPRCLDHIRERKAGDVRTRTEIPG